MSAFEGEINGLSSETIGKVVRQVLAELGFDLEGLAPSRSMPGRREHPKVLTALMQGKKVLAAEDGFLVCNFLANEALREEIKGILQKLERFGMKLCPTEKLAATFKQWMENGKQETLGVSQPAAPAAFKLITAKDIHCAVNGKQSTVRLTPGGKITPLAMDLAREYRIEIVNAD